MRGFVFAVVVVLAGCAAGPADRDAQPNLVQRARVLGENEASITIEHSEWGRAIAFRMADEHCARVKRVAVFRGSTHGAGPDMVSTWRCEVP